MRSFILAAALGVATLFTVSAVAEARPMHPVGHVGGFHRGFVGGIHHGHPGWVGNRGWVGFGAHRPYNWGRPYLGSVWGRYGYYPRYTSSYYYSPYVYGPVSVGSYGWNWGW